MKIFVKETRELKIQNVVSLFSEKVEVKPLISLKDVSLVDRIMISKSDQQCNQELEEYHVIIYEDFFEELSTRVIREYNYRHDYYYLKNALQHAQDKRIDTLISGSSYGAFAIDLSVLENTVNLSSISQDLYYTTRLLYRACNSNGNIKNVVICAGYYYYFSDLSLAKNSSELTRLSKVYFPLLNDTHNCFILPPKEILFLDNELVNFDLILNTYAEVEYNKGFFTDSRPRSILATKEWEDKKKSWAELSEKERDEAGKIRAERHNKSIKRKATLAENIYHFQEFVNFCKSKGINILMAVVPASKYYLKYLDPEFKRIFYSVLDSIEGDIHLLDLSEESFLDDMADFNDTDHLNDSGAIKYTQVLASVLDELN